MFMNFCEFPVMRQLQLCAYCQPCTAVWLRCATRDVPAYHTCFTFDGRRDSDRYLQCINVCRDTISVGAPTHFIMSVLDLDIGKNQGVFGRFFESFHSADVDPFFCLRCTMHSASKRLVLRCRLMKPWCCLTLLADSFSLVIASACQPLQQ